MTKLEDQPKIYRKSKEFLENYPDGLMIVCPSVPLEISNEIQYGERFLLEYGAWGFINLSRDPDYFALYVSSPVSAVKYFGVVDEIIDPKEEEHPVDNFQEYESYSDGDKLIMLKRDKIFELNDLIYYRSTHIQSFRYTTLNKFTEADSTEDFWE